MSLMLNREIGLMPLVRLDFSKEQEKALDLLSLDSPIVEFTSKLELARRINSYSKTVPLLCI